MSETLDRKRISIFGVTGSIGVNTVSVVESLGIENFQTVAVSGNANITGLAETAKRLNAEIEETLYRKIKMRAVEEGRSISDITRDLWSEYLSK